MKYWSVGMSWFSPAGGGQVCKLIPTPPREPRTVDWKTVCREMDERLADLPKFYRNPVLEMREDERF